MTDATPAEDLVDSGVIQAAVQKQVEHYFSRENVSQDSYLVSNMSQDLWVSVDVIARFKKLESLTTETEVIKAAINASDEVELNEAGDKVRPTWKLRRNTIILREISSDTPVEEVKSIFDNETCGEVVEIRPDYGDTWFVKFEDEDVTFTTFMYIRGQKFQGNPILCRIKAESLLRSVYKVNPAPAAAMAPPIFYDPHTAPYAYGQPVYMAGGQGAAGAAGQFVYPTAGAGGWEMGAGVVNGPANGQYVPTNGGGGGRGNQRGKHNGNGNGNGNNNGGNNQRGGRGGNKGGRNNGNGNGAAQSANNNNNNNNNNNAAANNNGGNAGKDGGKKKGKNKPKTSATRAGNSANPPAGRQRGNKYDNRDRDVDGAGNGGGGKRRSRARTAEEEAMELGLTSFPPLPTSHEDAGGYQTTFTKYSPGDMLDLFRSLPAPAAVEIPPGISVALEEPLTRLEADTPIVPKPEKARPAKQHGHPGRKGPPGRGARGNNNNNSRKGANSGGNNRQASGAKANDGKARPKASPKRGAVPTNSGGGAPKTGSAKAKDSAAAPPPAQKKKGGSWADIAKKSADKPAPVSPKKVQAAAAEAAASVADGSGEN